MFSGVSEELLRAEHNNDDNYERLKKAINACRQNWTESLMQGERQIISALSSNGYDVLLGKRRQAILSGDEVLPVKSVVVDSRLKMTGAIIAKMQRFGESLANMLDVWGYRVIVGTESDLDAAAQILGDLWETPSTAELTLRQGTMQFEARRDYRNRTHTGLSAATSLKYDQAIHLSRRAAFGICEIQAMTEDLYERAFVKTGSDEGHDSFAERRRKMLNRDESTNN